MFFARTRRLRNRVASARVSAYGRERRDLESSSMLQELCIRGSVDGPEDFLTLS